jgi:hypothetical protein
MKDIEFGDHVSVTSRMWRGEQYEKIKGKSRPVMAWRRRTGKMRGEPEAGVFLGWRTVQRGWTVWGGEYEDNHFKICGYDKVALVSLGPKENPVYIHPDDMEKI